MSSRALEISAYVSLCVCLCVLCLRMSEQREGERGGGPLQGRTFRSQMYFDYTNRSAYIYLTLGGNTPCSANVLSASLNKTFPSLLCHYI